MGVYGGQYGRSDVGQAMLARTAKRSERHHARTVSGTTITAAILVIMSVGFGAV